MDLVRISEIILIVLKPLKVVAYAGLAIMLYLNFIGPDGLAELFKVENPSKEGMEVVGLLIPNYVLIWTIATVIIEVIDNFFSMFQPLSQK